MSVELTTRSEPDEIDRELPVDVLECMVDRGEMEVVTAASGKVLHILQSIDE